MGSSRSTGGGKSPGERKAQTGNTIKKADQQILNTKLQGKKADQFARQAVGLTETKDGYIGTTYDSAQGKSFKSANQMYGATYNEAKGRYLESQGLATKREVTDTMGKTRTVYDPRTADGTYTNMTRMSAQEARANKTPLSKEMYNSQQILKTGIGLATMVMGVPLIPSVILNSASTPYSDYVNQTRQQGFYNFSTTQKGPIDKAKDVISKVTGEFADETEAQKKQKKYAAGSGQKLIGKQRSLLASSNKTFYA
tara:strand:- start:4102 stop:4863 length:762 start_codon:yes stop_codon:yes gene_type:complete